MGDGGDAAVGGLLVFSQGECLDVLEQDLVGAGDGGGEEDGDEEEQAPFGHAQGIFGHGLIDWRIE